MKKNLFLLLAVCLFCLFSCGGDNDDPEITVYELKVDKSVVTFETDGTSANNRLTITSNAAWQIVVPEEATWLAVDKTEGQGDAVVTISVKNANLDLELRSAMITIKSPDNKFASKGIDIKQKGTAPALSVNKQTITFEADGTSADNRLTITSNAAWQIVVPAGATWLAVDKTEGEGNALITISASGNNATTPRNALIGIKSPKGEFEPKNIEIKQTGSKPVAGDILSKIEDAVFKAYCCRFDTNGDGALSQTEAALVKEIDVERKSDLKSLKGIEYFAELEILHCSVTSISVLDLSKNKKLRELYCDGNPSLSGVNLSGNPALEKLYCDGCPITRLDLSKNIYLKELACSSTELSDLDLTQNIDLAMLNCAGARLINLDLSRNESLRHLNCSLTHIAGLDISRNIHLEALDCSFTFFPELDISRNIELRHLRCNDSGLNNIFVWHGFDTQNPKHSIAEIEYDAHTVFVVR